MRAFMTVILFAAIAFVGLAPESTGAGPSATVLPTALVSALLQAKANASAPAISFAGGASPGAVFVYATGTAVASASPAPKTPIPASSTTVFALASCSKPLTAMAVMQLVQVASAHQSGSSPYPTLGTPVFSYLGIATNPRHAKITLQNLLEHASGLPRDIDGEGTDPMSVAQVAATTGLDFDPGDKHVYSNAGYNVIGAVIEKATHQTYVDYVKNNVLKKAGVTDGGYLNGASASPIPRMAGRYPHGTGSAPYVETRESWFAPAGGWVLSASDVLKILLAFDAGKIVTTQTRETMLAPPPSPLTPAPDGSYVGFGFDSAMETASGGYAYAKNGGSKGAHCWLERDGAGNDFVVLTNGPSDAAAHRAGLLPVSRALDAAEPTPRG